MTSTRTTTAATRATRRPARQPSPPKRPARPHQTTVAPSVAQAANAEASVAEAFNPSVSLTKNGGGDFACWTCHATSFDQCEATGQSVQCRTNEDTCGLELRKRNRGEISEVRMGCTQRSQCEANKRQNFNHPRFTHTQCRPEDMFGQSVCRQCCHTSHCNRGAEPGSSPAWFNPTAKYTSRVDWAAERP